MLSAVLVSADVIHKTIGPTIASIKMTLATTSHNAAYVYRL